MTHALTRVVPRIVDGALNDGGDPFANDPASTATVTNSSHTGCELGVNAGILGINTDRPLTNPDLQDASGDPNLPEGTPVPVTALGQGTEADGSTITTAGAGGIDVPSTAESVIAEQPDLTGGAAYDHPVGLVEATADRAVGATEGDYTNRGEETVEDGEHFYGIDET